MATTDSGEEATQEVLQTQYVSTQQDDELMPPPSQPKKAPEQLWGRLMPLCGQVVPLMPRESSPGTLRFNLYKLGRSSQCDFLSRDYRVSNTHCTIYCERPAEPGQPLEVYLEDTSTNGTWVNGTIRLRKERRLLNTGDEICLINPDLESHTTSHEQGEKDVQMNSLTFINLSGRVMEPRSVTLHRAPTGFVDRTRKLERFYDKKELLGTGTSGKVYRVIHRQTGLEYAVKVIETRKFRLTPGMSTEEIIQEALMMKEICHPYIVNLKEIFQTDSEIQLVMDLVKGGDLFDRVVDRRKFSEHTARECFYRILIAVQYLHSEGICHRDLKPENILMVDRKSDIDIKITDFGLAKKGNEMKTFCGTPQYFAPEVLKRRNTVAGAGRYGMEADMWSLGVILYILLSGTMPFHDETLFTQIQNASFTFDDEAFHEVSKDAKDLIKKLLCPDPQRRYSADQAIKHPWMRNREDGMGVSLSQAPSLEYAPHSQDVRSPTGKVSYETDGGSESEGPSRNKNNPAENNQNAPNLAENMQTPSAPARGRGRGRGQGGRVPAVTPDSENVKKSSDAIVLKPAVNILEMAGSVPKQPASEEIREYSSSDEDNKKTNRKKVVISAPDHQQQGGKKRKSTNRLKEDNEANIGIPNGASLKEHEKLDLSKIQPPASPERNEEDSPSKKKAAGGQQTLMAWFKK